MWQSYTPARVSGVRACLGRSLGAASAAPPPSSSRMPIVGARHSKNVCVPVERPSYGQTMPDPVVPGNASPARCRPRGADGNQRLPAIPPSSSRMPIVGARHSKNVCVLVERPSYGQTMPYPVVPGNASPACCRPRGADGNQSLPAIPREPLDCSALVPHRPGPDRSHHRCLLLGHGGRRLPFERAWGIMISKPGNKRTDV
jgi:hypothetical protein